MASDVQLHFRRTLLLRRGIFIDEPKTLRKTASGTFGKLPPQWLSPNRLIAPVDALDAWTRGTLGDPIVRAINQHAQSNGGLTRVLISSDDAIRQDVFAAPWELLEHTPAALRSAQLCVVRLLRGNAQAAGPEPVPRLRLLVLYADPAKNIVELPTHMQALQNFATGHDEMLDARILSFPDTESVLQQCTGFNPHVVYYIGHGGQIGNGQVHLHINNSGGISMAAFAVFLNQLGAPRVVVLNACESFAGATLDPYLGAALRLSPQFDFVVSMQMKEPIPAATAFAAALLGAIARGEGMAAAMVAGRTAMAACAERQFEVTPYIPVLMQRTRCDSPFTVDVGEHERIRLLKLMASRLEQIERLPRDTEAHIRDVLTGGGKHCVSILTGPPECGKSTSVRGVLASLITDEEIRKGHRYLYFSAKHLPRTGNLADDISHLFQAFARDCGHFTESLRTSLVAEARANPQASPVATLTTWLEYRKLDGYRFVLLLDDLAPEVATEIARRGSGLITAGHVMVVSRSHGLEGALVERLTLEPMEFARPITEYPYPLVQLVALSNLPIPAEVVTLFGVDVSSSDALGISRTADGALTVSPWVRAQVLEDLGIKDEVHFRQQLASAYEEVAYDERTGGFRRARVISLYREALRQRVRILECADFDPAPAETLREARFDLFDLDHQLLEEGNEPAEAIVLWNLYRKAAAPFADDREADARYARLLQRRGSIQEADEILRSWSKSGPLDALQIRILLAHDEVLHDLGRDRSERLEIISRAREILAALRTGNTMKERELDELEAQVEQAHGNALGYGEGAKPDEAVAHLARAVEIFEALRDYRAEGAYAEKIEVARYNNLLSDSERTEAIERIYRSVESLVARSAQRDAVDRLYELGRLATDPAERAKWYRAAYERAGDGYEPTRTHAAIHWKRAEMEANRRPFAAVAAEIDQLCEKLREWKESAWSRRVLRDALHFLARQYAAAGDVQAQRRYLLEAREIISDIERYGERRGDRAARVDVDEEIRALPAHELEGGSS
jgi:hypothetical protein